MTETSTGGKINTIAYEHGSSRGISLWRLVEALSCARCGQRQHRVLFERAKKGSKLGTRLIFTDKEYIGNPDDELAGECTADQANLFQPPEVAQDEFELANGWFLA